MDSNSPPKGVAAGFHVSTASLDAVQQKLAEVRDHFQGKVDTLKSLESQLGDAFFGGNEGETGAFQRSYQAFGHEWVRQINRILTLDQRFVNLINEHSEAVRNAATMYAKADEDARLKMQSILDDTMQIGVRRES